MQEIKTSLDSEGKVLSVSIDTRPPQIINNSDIKNYMQLQAKLDKAVEALKRCKVSAENWIQQSPHTELVINTTQQTLAEIEQ